MRAAAPAALAWFQEELEEIYGVAAPPVGDYLVDRDAALAAVGRLDAPELLLVREEEGGAALGLFLDEPLLAAALRARPHLRRSRLTARRQLGQLACVAEGVSHFVYLSSRALAGRQVSLLELEVQAEVDKFALLVLHLWRRGRRRASRALRHRLYERVRYRPHLDGPELERYRTANRLAAGYAGWLEARFVRRGDAEGLLRELRASYRLSGPAKLRHLAARAAG
ncbi:hypothetical protein [Anaeromyxobacter paludicola]|uniref:Uncharacterized protein n=1 Tax=Anaeromyxobacter paludicola TaxID=2918171 RepID=A0ABM7XAM0_9BACT|nr:hypothetical protein [Anaeromyxobacter paludicola]BDG08905.1 hypothetical protein AMPC_20180 [Anaeromyxobacter paludicola]